MLENFLHPLIIYAAIGLLFIILVYFIGLLFIFLYILKLAIIATKILNKLLYRFLCESCTLDDIKNCFSNYEFIKEYNTIKFKLITILAFFLPAIKFGIDFIQIFKTTHPSNNTFIKYDFAIAYSILIGVFTLLLIFAIMSQSCLLCQKYKQQLKKKKRKRIKAYQ